MRFRLGVVTGFATGYYLGARAGRQRYEQINRSLSKLRGSESFEAAAEKARAVVDEGVEKARSIVDSRTSGGGEGAGEDPVTITTSGSSNGFGPDETAGLIVAGDTTSSTTAEIIVPGPTGETGTQTDPPASGGTGGYSSSR
jgi:hypothetical protein